MRSLALLLAALLLTALSACGYRPVGASSHLPPDVRTLAVPLFATRTDSYHTEVQMTAAVVREFAARTRLRVTPGDKEKADLVLSGVILKENTAPLTYNTTTQQSSSYLVTIVAAVKLTDRNGKVLYENNNYVFRQQYSSTTDLPAYFQEKPAAVERLSREFASALVADVLESF